MNQQNYSSTQIWLNFFGIEPGSLGILNLEDGGLIWVTGWTSAIILEMNATVLFSLFLSLST